jgi:hypothetical protein
MEQHWSIWRERRGLVDPTTRRHGVAATPQNRYHTFAPIALSWTHTRKTASGRLFDNAPATSGGVAGRQQRSPTVIKRDLPELLTDYRHPG